MELLDSFAKLRLEAISFVTCFWLPVCLSAWNNAAPSEPILFEFDVCIFSQNQSNFKFH
jgi:hypothetical protein